MTIASAGPTFVQLPGNGVATVFAFPFKIFQAGDLVVGFITASGYVVQASGFTVQNVDVNGGGSITFSTPPPNGTTVDIRSLTPEVQNTEFANLGAFLPQTHTEAFDRLTRMVQDLYRLTYQFGIHGPDQEATVWTALPKASARANTGLMFDINGLPTVGALVAQTLTQSLIGQFLYPQTTQEAAVPVTPTNFWPSPSHIGDDVRRYGNIDLTGATDCRAILNTANSIGVALYFPAGTYRISSNLTLSVPLILESGAIFKPDSGITVTLNGILFAGPVKIFDTSAGGSFTTGGSLWPMLSGGRLYVEWFGAGQGAADDSAAMNATAVLASLCTRAIQLLPKTYNILNTVYAAGVSGQQVNMSAFYGAGGYWDLPNGSKALTTINSSGFTSSLPMIQYRGVNQAAGAVVDNIRFTGSATNSIAIEMNGVQMLPVTRCRFDVLALGLHWNNSLSGSFTEYCSAESCDFTANCVIKGQYDTVAGASSFHGSGFKSRCTFNQNGGSAIIMNSGVHVYNAPMDIQMWSDSGTATLFACNTTIAPMLHGNITLEPSAANAVVLASTNPVLFAGSLTSNNENVSCGTLFRCGAIVQTAANGIIGIDRRRMSFGTLTTGANTLSANTIVSSRLVNLHVRATNYAFDCLLLVGFVSGGTNGYVATLNSQLLNNGAGFGAPTFTANTSANLIVTNAGYPASGVTYRMSEVELANVSEDISAFAFNL